MKKRYFIKLSFKGTSYHGWQIQPNAVSVQQVLNEVLSVILHEPVETIGAGRTDAGVHATCFFAHFDCDNDLNGQIQSTIKSLNAILPDDIAVHDIFPVKQDVHARFTAISRTYQYTILKRKHPFLNDYAWLCHFQLDSSLMNEAARILFQYTDFTSFSKLHTDVATNNCKISEAVWNEDEEKLVFTVTADRFLRNMVRSIVGTMVDAGRRKIDLEAFERIIQAKNREAAGMSVPAKGLVLYNIEYPVNIHLSLAE